MIANGFYLDTEFIECAKQRSLFGLPIGRPVDTIDLISLALVNADGKRELYVLNRQCELDYAWANEWVRENVLRAIYEDHIRGERRQHLTFSLQIIRAIFHDHGHSRAEIAQLVLRFVLPIEHIVEVWNRRLGNLLATRFNDDEIMLGLGSYLDRNYTVRQLQKDGIDLTPTFYTYYGAYDWVVFCQSLFGRMNDLPAGLPKYAVDLKQEQDRLGIGKEAKRELCPKPVDEHNALADAHWNRRWHLTMQAYDPTYSLPVNKAKAQARINHATAQPA